ncbi:MAG: hypothetical protein HKO56_01285, partial [Bacteroidia bacterium]|nr:hypothetical protein [Bacteroidia bacterium]
FEQLYNISETKGLEKNVLTDLYKSKTPGMLKFKKLLPSFIRKPIAAMLNKNYRQEIPEMTDNTVNQLRNLYKQDISKLSQLINKDLSSWN